MKFPAPAFFRRAANAALVLGVLAVSTPAYSGTIGFQIESKITAGPGIDANISIKHTGDEAAEQVSLHAEVLGKTVDGAAVASIAPGASHTWDLHLVDRVPAGVYVVAVWVRYSDANGYPFEVLSIAPATVGGTAGSKIFGSLSLPKLTVKGKTTAHLTAKLPPGRSGTFEAHLVVPSGLKVEPETFSLKFDETGVATAPFEITNLKLLAGTTVNVFAFISDPTANFPQTDTIRGNVRISAASAKSAPPKFYQMAIALLVLLSLLEAAAWALGRRRTGE